MKIVINSTDFSDICTAVYYSTPKLIRSWLVSDTIPVDSNGNLYTQAGSVDMINDLPNLYGRVGEEEEDIKPKTYYSVDEGRYFAFVSPELENNEFQSALNQYSIVDPETRIVNPDLLPKKVYYHGSKNRILERDFAEYDFSWLVDKGRFNSNLNIQSLDDAGKELIGNKVEELTKLEDILFPTQYTIKQWNSDNEYGKNDIVFFTAPGEDTAKYYLSKENNNTGHYPHSSPDFWEETQLINKNYFGTTKIGNYTLFLFPADPEIGKIELYDTILEEDELEFYKNFDYRTLEQPNPYNPDSEYSIGDIATISDDNGFNITYYRSLVNGNQGNDPSISNTEWKEIKKPCLSIYLGLDYCWDQTSNDRYILNPGTWSSNFPANTDNYFRLTPTRKEYFKSLDEEKSSKEVWMVLTDSGQLVSINLTLNSWTTDKINPERNKWKYSLRNDEFWSTKDSMSLVTDKSKILVDGRSSTILATERISKHPILDKKLKKFNLLSYKSEESYNEGDKVWHEGKLWECLRSYSPDEPNLEHEPGENSTVWNEIIPNYSPYCVYRCGEYVVFNYSIWESLVDNNLGNRPDCSRSWIFKATVSSITRNGHMDISRLLDDYLNIRVSVIMNPNGAGHISPAGQITINDSDTYYVFRVFENLGYQLRDAEDGCITTELVESDDFSGSSDVYSNVTIENATTEIATNDTSSLNCVKIVKIDNDENWERILNSKKLIFNFKDIDSKFTILGLLNNTEHQFANGSWENLGYPELSVYVDNVEIEEESGGETYKAGVGKTVKLVDECQSGESTYRITKVNSRYVDALGNTIVKPLQIQEEIQEDQDNNEIVVHFVEDVVDYRTATYIYYFDINTNTVSCIIGLEDFEMTDNRVDIPYGENHTFKFYRRDRNDLRTIKVTLSDNISEPGASTWSSNTTATYPGNSVPFTTQYGTAPYREAKLKTTSSLPYYEIQLTEITGYIEIKIEYVN